MSSKPKSTIKAKAKPPRVPGYVVGEEIGRGAMGIVYRATQQIVDREVALKVLHPEHSNTPRLVSRLRREARTTARLAHPHVVSAIDMGETDGLWWYAMEFVDGEPLSERIKSGGKLTERSALRLLIPLCEALEHLRENGVVHRDIKPGNILISKVGGARLADLGLAFAEDDPSLTGRGGTLGTPHYISPEQAVDSRRADVRSDIWSFGATFFHAVCGQPPFSGSSTAEILSAVLYSPVPDPRELTPELSKGLALILRKCLTRDPEQRYQTPGELLRDLERVRERRPPKISQRSLDPVAGEEGSKRVHWLVSAALLALLGGLWWTDALGLRNLRSQGESVDVVPFEPLESIARRLPPAPEDVALCLRELSTLREVLDPMHQSRWEEINANLMLWLGQRMHSAQNQVGRQVEEALLNQDFALAELSLQQQYPNELRALVGLDAAELASLGLQSKRWSESLSARLAADQAKVVSVFEDQLAAWTSNLRLRIDAQIDAGDWAAAAALLAWDLDAVQSDLKRKPLRVSQKLLNQLDQLLQIGLTVSGELLKDRLRAMDQELSLRLRERFDQLLEELEKISSPRPYAALEFERAFQEELELLGLDFEQLPSSLSVTCEGLFQQRHAALNARESELLEQDARQEIAATLELCAALWKARAYEKIAELWVEVRQQMQQLEERTRDGDDDWRVSLERDCALREGEARLVQREVLQRAADQIVELNGAKLEKLTVGGITLSRKKVKSGLFPLIDGFRVEDFPEPIFLQELGYTQLLQIAGLDALDATRGEKRMALAAFLYHEGHHSEAGALLGQEVFLQDDLEDLYWDLERRVALASGARREDRDARVDDALFKLEYVFNSGNQLHMANKVQLYVDSLLGELGDLDEVRSRASRLREVRDQMRSKSNLPPKDAIRLAYKLDPEHLRFSGAKDVSMDFVFDSNVAGTWQKGQWIFDALGWVSREKVKSWDELIYQNGPRLNLVEPLIVDRFVLLLEIESVDGGQPQLFALSAMGFNLALFGPGLPGEKAGYGLCAGSGPFDEFLEELERAKRAPREALLLPKQKHQLRLEGYRTTGSLKVELDGLTIWNGNLGAARGEDPNIQVASWDRVRLTQIRLEASR